MARPPRLRPFAWLCGVSGVAFTLAGLAFVVGFFGYHAPNSEPGIPTGPGGFYFVAFTGCALVGWGGSLLSVARRPETGRAIGSVTSFALVLMALYRMAGWIMGDYYAWVGDLLRVEAAIFLLFSLAFLWLRPPKVAEEFA
jgi:hypothetical protein